jgi:hypothetical protein
MKVAAQVLLIVFFIILFFVGLISTTFKFQLLDYNFWQNAFQKHNVYQNLAVVSRNSFESQIAKEGGNKNDVKVLTDLITEENAKDVVNHNLRNLLNFTNGKSYQINVYLPVDKVPRSLLPKNISGVKTEMPITDLLTKFNFQDWQKLPWQDLSNLGKISYYFFIGTISLLLLIFILLILLVENGARFIGLGTVFVLSGGFTFFLINIVANINKVLTQGVVQGSSIMSVVVGTIMPPILNEMISSWQILGVILLIAGVTLFFIKKPGYNNPE